jgi:site-specific DNA-methyltransferase (cytosine-N4-specific)
LHSRFEDALPTPKLRGLKGKVQLVLTSPPFPLNTKKSYGNLQGEAYRDWFVSLAEPLAELLTPTGSIVIELGNAWEPNRPIQSLLPLECLLGFAKAPKANLRLCQQFVCYNPARLPSPAQWVTVRRERVTDSYTQVWWFAGSDSPFADNSRVLRPYSNSMRGLLQSGTFNRKRRPSHHHISENGFLADRGGSIAHNLFELEPIASSREVRLPNAFALSNTASNDTFTRECTARGITPHPARMPAGLAAFFIQFLTKKRDLVFDPFAGSNTTGFVAELLGRRWLSLDAEEKYGVQSEIRFRDLILSPSSKMRRPERGPVDQTAR